MTPTIGSTPTMGQTIHHQQQQTAAGVPGTARQWSCPPPAQRVHCNPNDELCAVSGLKFHMCPQAKQDVRYRSITGRPHLVIPFNNATNCSNNTLINHSIDCTTDAFDVATKSLVVFMDAIDLLKTYPSVVPQYRNVRNCFDASRSAIEFATKTFAYVMNSLGSVPMTMLKSITESRSGFNSLKSAYDAFCTSSNYFNYSFSFAEAAIYYINSVTISTLRALEFSKAMLMKLKMELNNHERISGLSTVCHSCGVLRNVNNMFGTPKASQAGNMHLVCGNAPYGVAGNRGGETVPKPVSVPTGTDNAGPMAAGDVNRSGIKCWHNAPNFVNNGFNATEVPKNDALKFDKNFPTFGNTALDAGINVNNSSVTNVVTKSGDTNNAFVSDWSKSDGTDVMRHNVGPKSDAETGIKVDNDDANSIEAGLKFDSILNAYLLLDSAHNAFDSAIKSIIAVTPALNEFKNNAHYTVENQVPKPDDTGRDSVKGGSSLCNDAGLKFDNGQTDSGEAGLKSDNGETKSDDTGLKFDNDAPNSDEAGLNVNNGDPE